MLQLCPWCFTGHLSSLHSTKHTQYKFSGCILGRIWDKSRSYGWVWGAKRLIRMTRIAPIATANIILSQNKPRESDWHIGDVGDIHSSRYTLRIERTLEQHQHHITCWCRLRVMITLALLTPCPNGIWEIWAVTSVRVQAYLQEALRPGQWGRGTVGEMREYTLHGIDTIKPYHKVLKQQSQFFRFCLHAENIKAWDQKDISSNTSKSGWSATFLNRLPDLDEEIPYSLWD